MTMFELPFMPMTTQEPVPVTFELSVMAPAASVTSGSAHPSRLVGAWVSAARFASAVWSRRVAMTARMRLPGGGGVGIRATRPQKGVGQAIIGGEHVSVSMGRG